MYGTDEDEEVPVVPAEELSLEDLEDGEPTEAEPTKTEEYGPRDIATLVSRGGRSCEQ